MNRKRWLTAATTFLVICSLFLLPTSCSPTASTVGLAPRETPRSTSTETSAGDYKNLSDRLNNLEERVKRLEQGLDERVIEHNIVQSAVYKMIIDNGLFDKDSGNINLGGSGSWAPTNNMRIFPYVAAPLFGYDKNKDGKSDTNYVPFDTSKWFYQYYDKAQVQQFPDLGWNKVPKRPATMEETLGKTQAAATETHNVQTAVMAAMADVNAGTITAGAFGNTGHANPPTGTDLTIVGPKKQTTVGAFIVGGATNVRGAYTVGTDGSVTRTWYPQ